MSNFLLKYHFLIKRYTKALAKLYLNKKIIDNENDIWYIDINYLYSYIDGDIDPLIIKENIKTNKTYYNSYRNYNNISYLGTRHNKEKYDLLGEGYSGTVFKGIVRKIKNLKELETLTKDDILVTKTLNDNLLFHLPEVSGIIVSDNYLSSNVKTILREMNIPCFMLDNCSKKLNNGDSITVYVYDGGIKNNKKR